MNLKRLFFRLSEDDKTLSRSILAITGFSPRKIRFYKLALRHRSATGSDNIPENNERLEFLGDAIFDAVISHYLYERFPMKSEGFLSKMRARIVNREYVNELAMKIGIHALLKSNLRKSDISENLYGNAFEALIGAIYMDKGYKGAADFITGKLLTSHIQINELIEKDKDYKSKVIKWGQQVKKEVRFDTEAKNDTCFLSKVRIEEVIMGTGEAPSKKKAEQLAAKEACIKIGA